MQATIGGVQATLVIVVLLVFFGTRDALSSDFEECERICASQSASCLKIPLSLLDQALLEKLIDVGLLADGGRVSKQHLMQTFQIDSDPCSRSETIIENRKILNEGNQCSIIGGPALLKMGLTVPGKIEGDVSLENGWVVGKFSTDARIMLVLKSALLGIDRVRSWDFVATDGSQILTHIGDECLIVH